MHDKIFEVDVQANVPVKVPDHCFIHVYGTENGNVRIGKVKSDGTATFSRTTYTVGNSAWLEIETMADGNRLVSEMVVGSSSFSATNTRSTLIPSDAAGVVLDFNKAGTFVVYEH